MRFQIALFLCKDTDVGNFDQVSVLQSLEVDENLLRLNKMHRAVNETQGTARVNAIARHNAKKHVQNFKTIVRGYIFVSRTKGPRIKISSNWIGPR